MGIVAPFLWLVDSGGAMGRMESGEATSPDGIFPDRFRDLVVFLHPSFCIYVFWPPPYQNYLNNAYAWLLLGVLFRLPKLAEMPVPIAIPRHLRAVPRWRLALIGK